MKFEIKCTIENGPLGSFKARGHNISFYNSVTLHIDIPIKQKSPCQKGKCRHILYFSFFGEKSLDILFLLFEIRILPKKKRL